ncbi:MAG: transporter [Gammaproteobacteria bacterium]
MYRTIRKLILSITLFSLSANVFADANDNPCVGPIALLSIVNRPTAADSACVVPYKSVVLEMGYQYQKLTGRGYQQNLPAADVRIGLPAKNELVIILPNYIKQSIAPRAGFAVSGFGIKHDLITNAKIQAAIESLFTLPSGSYAFGVKGLGTALNGILSYNMTSQLNFSFMFGVSTQTESRSAGGTRFTSFNPDLVVTYSLKNNLDIYGEVYGQTKTAPGQGSGFNFDGGLIYLACKNLTIDIEASQRINGKLGGFDHYIGTGLAILI